MNHVSIVPTTRVGDIVAAHPLLATVFERVGIDYCCGGKKTLADACAAKGLDAATLAAALAAAVQLAGSSAPAIDVAGLSLTALADHIERTHHAYLKEELPQLVEKADRVATKHGWRDPRLPAVAETARELADEMFHHMAKEERILFPIIRALEQAKTSAAAGGHCGSIANPIRQMEAEHDSAAARWRACANSPTGSPRTPTPATRTAHCSPDWRGWNPICTSMCTRRTTSFSRGPFRLRNNWAARHKKAAG